MCPAWLLFRHGRLLLILYSAINLHAILHQLFYLRCKLPSTPRAGSHFQVRGAHRANSKSGQDLVQVSVMIRGGNTAPGGGQVLLILRSKMVHEAQHSSFCGEFRWNSASIFCGGLVSPEELEWKWKSHPPPLQVDSTMLSFGNGMQFYIYLPQ